MNEKECLNSGGIWVNNVCFPNRWDELHEIASKHEINNRYSDDIKSNNDNFYFICFILLFIVVFSLLIFLIKKSKLFS